MHNGGAYGDGTTEIGVGFGFGAARTAGKLGQLTFSAGVESFLPTTSRAVPKSVFQPSKILIGQKRKGDL